MAHRHLVIAYAFTWGLQLVYLGYIGLKWKSVNRRNRG